MLPVSLYKRVKNHICRGGKKTYQTFIFMFYQTYSFYTYFLLTQHSAFILVYTVEISKLWKLMSLRTEMIHACTHLRKSRNIATGNMSQLMR